MKLFQISKYAGWKDFYLPGELGGYRLDISNIKKVHIYIYYII